MQNVESTHDENLDLAQSPNSLSSQRVATTLSQSTSTTPTQTRTTSPAPTISYEAVHSEPETRTKKSRSRFSSAIRKLSGSTRRKQHPATSQETVVSSGGEDAASTQGSSTTETEHTKKKSLSKRFLLSGLKKSKISPSTSIETAIADYDEETTKVDEKLNLDSTQQPEEEQKEITSSKPTVRTPKQSSVQIKISGKKKSVETQKSAPTGTGDTKSKSISISSEPDYLTPSEKVQTQAKGTKQTTAPTDIIAPKATASATSAAPTSATTSAKGESKVESATTKKKLKLKKATTLGSSQTKSGVTKETTEKLVITQSISDLPPHERAPLRPSRSHSDSVSSTADAEAVTVTAATATATKTTQAQQFSAVVPPIRKPTTRAAATLTSPSLAQRIIGSATKAKKQRAAATLATGEADLMKDSQSSLQRGHRFPRPSSTTTTAAPTTPTVTATTQPTIALPKQHSTTTVTASTSASASTTTTTPASPLPSASASAAALATKSTEPTTKKRLEFHLKSKSHASQSLPQTEDTNVSVSVRSDQLEPPAYPPPPIPHSTSLTPVVIRSPAHQIPTTLTATKDATLGNVAETQSVVTTSSSGADDFLSSAESAAQQANYSRPISEALSEEGTESALRIAARSLRKFGGSRSFHSSRSSGSPSPVSDSSRRRIHYNPQQSIFNEDSVSKSRADDDFSLQTEATEHSYDTENEIGDNQMPAFGDLTMDEEMEPTIMTSAIAEKREHLYKILVIGELGTGKTSFIKRYVHQFFSQNYRATIGVDFALKVLHWDANTIVRLQLWDIAGQERFGNMTRVYYKEAVGAFIVFDVTRSGTFDCVSKWKEDLDSKVQLPDGSPIPCILLANKCDQEKQGIVTQPEKMDEYVKENGFAGWFETSAKENVNIDEAARALVSKILLNDKLISAADLADSEKFNLNKSSDQTDGETKSKCSC